LTTPSGNHQRFDDYRHGGRSGMSELERLLHLLVSFRFLFGSRRGIVAPLLLVGIVVAGWFIWQQFSGPNRILESAHRKWDSGETQLRIEAIAEYKAILRKKDPIEPQHNLLTNRNERGLLYRRIIEFHVKFDIDERDARDWVVAAWQENIRDLNFGDDQVDGFYRSQVEEIRIRGINPPVAPNPAGSSHPNGVLSAHSG